MTTNIFKQLDKKKFSNILYPKESIDFLTSLFSKVNIEFDPTMKIDHHLKTLTKQEFENILGIFLEFFSDPTELNKQPSSVKYLVTRILEQYLFKWLETIYYYNICNDPLNRSLHEIVETALNHIYTCNIYPSSYILISDIQTLLTSDWTKITDHSEMEKKLLSIVKKNNFVYSLTNNKKWNSLHSESHIKDTFLNMTNLNYNLPDHNIINFSSINWITDKEMSTCKDNKSDIILAMTSDEPIYYFTKPWSILREKRNEILVLDYDFNTVTHQWDYTYEIDPSIKLQLTFNQDIWSKYVSLFPTYMVRRLYDEKLTEITYQFTNVRDRVIINSFIENNLPFEIHTKYWSFSQFVLPSKVTINNVDYTNRFEIIDAVTKCDDDDIIIAYYNSPQPYIFFKDLNRTFLFNTNLITGVSLHKKSLSLEQIDRLLFNPLITSYRTIKRFIDNLLNNDIMRYNHNYQDIKPLQLSHSINKIDLTKHQRGYKTKLLKLDSILELGRLLPKTLSENE